MPQYLGDIAKVANREFERNRCSRHLCRFI
jgi:hypothetical protein